MALNRFYLTENSIAQRSGLCIFISHQKRDADTAKKIAEKFPETAEVIDIDYLFNAWLHREAEKIQNKEVQKDFLKNVERQGDDYLKLNLENFEKMIGHHISFSESNKNVDNTSFIDVHKAWGENDRPSFCDNPKHGMDR